MNYWIFKIGEQKTYPDVAGVTYVYDNTHSVRVQAGDEFIYLSTKNNRYEFTGHGVVKDVAVRHPVGAEKRNDRVNRVYTAQLNDVMIFNEPLDFLPSTPTGGLNRKAVGVKSALPWGISIPRLEPTIFHRLVGLAQPATTTGGNSAIAANANQPKGAPAKGWTHPATTATHTLADQAQTAVTAHEYEPSSFEDARERVARSLVLRRGQPEFRKRLTEAYGARCAITGCDVLDALEAAHIYPYRGEETNHVTNGLLLRSDIHALFDLGLLMVDTKDMTVVLHPSLRGSSYGGLQGTTLSLPMTPALRPSIVLLDWHRTWWQTDS